MDAIDRSLLGLLAEDSSKPLKTLAAQVGLSRSSVRDRIARLRSQGVIRRFTIELRPQPDALRAVLLVRLKSTPDPISVRGITARTEVVRCYSMSGPIDLLVELAGSAVADLNGVRDEIALMPGVADVETSFVLNCDKAVAH